MSVDCCPATPSHRSRSTGWSITPSRGVPRYSREMSVPNRGLPGEGGVQGVEGGCGGRGGAGRGCSTGWSITPSRGVPRYSRKTRVPNRGLPVTGFWGVA